MSKVDVMVIIVLGRTNFLLSKVQNEFIGIESMSQE